MLPTCGTHIVGSYGAHGGAHNPLVGPVSPQWGPLVGHVGPQWGPLVGPTLLGPTGPTVGPICGTHMLDQSEPFTRDPTAEIFQLTWLNVGAKIPPFYIF